MITISSWNEYLKYHLYRNSILTQVSLSAVGEGGPYQLEKNEGMM